MFFALSEQLDLIKGIKISHDELRRTIVQHLRENPKLVSAFFFFIIFRVDIFAVYARGSSQNSKQFNSKHPSPPPLSLSLSLSLSYTCSGHLPKTS